jgi:hypothetical protein
MVALPRKRPADAADWPVLTVDRLDRESVRALLGNRVAAIRRPGLLDERACAESIAVLRASDAWDSYVADGPPTGKLGISQYAYGADKDGYFADAAAALDQRARVVAAIPDPLPLVHAELAAAWDAPVCLAQEDGRRYFAGVFRSGAGIRLHADWAPRDGVGWLIEDVVAQLAWNMYYAKPEVGGELVVYDRSWTPDLELGARQRFYDYDPAAVRHRRRVEIAFEAGDVVLFSSSNVHEVVDSPDGSTRVTASSFVGERTDGSLLLWS